MVRILYMDENKAVHTREQATADEIRKLKKTSSTLWVNLYRPTETEIDAILRGVFSFHELAIDDCLNETHHPKIDEFDDHLFIIMNGIPNLEEGEFFRERRINAFIAERYLVTVHLYDSVAITSVFNQCEKNHSYVAKGPDHIYHLIIDITTDQYLDAMEILNEKIDDLEDKVFTTPDDDLLNDIIMEKHQILALHHTIRHQKDILGRLSTNGYKLITKKERMYYRNVFDHLMRVSDAIDFNREQVNSLLSVYLSVTSNKMNEVMKVLTIIATIMLPLTLVAGIYGMNFHHMPELGWGMGYPLAIGLMVIITAGFLWFFRRKKWL